MRLARGWFPVLAADLVAAGEETVSWPRASMTWPPT
jgi:hypothetical protein